MKNLFFLVFMGLLLSLPFDNGLTQTSPKKTPGPSSGPITEVPENIITDTNKWIGIIENTSSYKYFPVGKPDPFRPIFKKKSKKIGDKNKVLTPLQRFDLGQLELTTIVTGKMGKKALVMDPTGKGYIVTIGTLIGNNNGKVVEISGTRLIVDEKIQDRLGNIKHTKRYLEMKGDQR